MLKLELFRAGKVQKISGNGYKPLLVTIKKATRGESSLGLSLCDELFGDRRRCLQNSVLGSNI